MCCLHIVICLPQNLKPINKGLFHCCCKFLKVKLKVQTTTKKKELVMTEKNIYSRAYHKEETKSGNKELARKLGNAAVKLWLASM